MARKAAVEKQKYRERLVLLKKDKRKELKKIIIDMTKSDEERMAAVHALNKLPRNSSKIRLRNRCKRTGRCSDNGGSKTEFIEPFHGVLSSVFIDNLF